MSAFETAHVRSAGLTLSAQHWGGDGRDGVVVMLHGVARNGLDWNELGPRLARALPEGVAVVSFDQRGHGSSSKPLDDRYDPDFFAYDVLSVRDHFGGGPLTLVGHSRGGWLSTYVASHWPDDVHRLVLVDPARLTFAGESAADAFYGRVREQLGPFPSPEAALEFARLLDPYGRWTPARRESLLAGYDPLPSGGVIGKLPRRVVDHLQDARVQVDRVTPWLSRVRCPTLLLVATTSGHERQRQKLAYADHIAGCEKVFMDGGHYLAQDCPDEVADHVLRFL